MSSQRLAIISNQVDLINPSCCAFTMGPSATSTPKSKPSSTSFKSNIQGVKWEDAPVSGIQFLRSDPTPMHWKVGSNLLVCFIKQVKIPLAQYTHATGGSLVYCHTGIPSRTPQRGPTHMKQTAHYRLVRTQGHVHLKLSYSLYYSFPYTNRNDSRARQADSQNLSWKFD